MELLSDTSLLAAGGDNPLISISLGVMIWTLIAFGVTMWLLAKVAFPRISEALDRRRKAIEDSIDHAERTRREADELLDEYRSRLREAREQADEIVVRARKAGDRLNDDAKEKATQQREELLAAAGATSRLRPAARSSRSAGRWPTSRSWPPRRSRASRCRRTTTGG